MKLNKFLYIGVAAMLSLTSCNDFLDKLPDNRIDPNSPEQLRLVLAGGYAEANYALLCELSSDNAIDNHAPDEKGLSYPNLGAFSQMDDQAFAWEDVNKESMQDSPTYLWSSYYKSVAVANHVLAKVDEFRAEGRYTDGRDSELLDAVYGEALLIRAYYHFVLVNLFAPQYRGEASANDQGIPYCLTPEDKVFVDYQRESVKAVYDKIEQDLLEGLKHINDQFHKNPKFHFNAQAAKAFAARFYLYKRDYANAEKYATEALGASPEQMLRTNFWSSDFGTNYDACSAAYFSSSSANNLLLVPAVSNVFNHFAGGARYAISRDARVATMTGSAPTWSQGRPGINYSFVNGSNEYGSIPFWMAPFFQYTDKVAGIGYFRSMIAEFTGEECLLIRAEARIFQNNLPGAVSDLAMWDNSQYGGNRGKAPVLTAQLIESYYNKANSTTGQFDPRPFILQDLHIDDLYPVDNAQVTAQNLPYLWCVLHFRRIEQVFTGMRWFDVKRFGIEITHKIGETRVETLPYNDLRRAFQVPIEVLSSGMEPTVRAGKLPDPSEMGSWVKPIR